MIPWRSTQVMGAFAAALAAVWAASQAVLGAQAPLETAAVAMAVSGLGTFGVVLWGSLVAGLARNRVRRAVCRGDREVRQLCAAFLRQRRLRLGRDDWFFLDDPAPAAVEGLRRDLAAAGVRVSSSELLQYLLVCRLAGRSDATDRRLGRPPRAAQGTLARFSVQRVG